MDPNLTNGDYSLHPQMLIKQGAINAEYVCRLKVLERLCRRLRLAVPRPMNKLSMMFQSKMLWLCLLCLFYKILSNNLTQSWWSQSQSLYTYHPNAYIPTVLAKLHVEYILVYQFTNYDLPTFTEYLPIDVLCHEMQYIVHSIIYILKCLKLLQQIL